MSYWSNRSVVLLGGASLIGSHLAEALVKEGVKNLRIVDNFSVGKRENLAGVGAAGAEIYNLDLRDLGSATLAVRKFDIVFHLASQHGGRGYVSSHATNLWNNLELDTVIFRACEYANVEKVIFSSSACAYPNYLQDNVGVEVKLCEEFIDYNFMVQPDGPYGTEKLVGELMLDAYVNAEAFNGVSTRSFTVYGPRMGETHAICAFIARSMIKQNPFEIWGKKRGLVRNWTHVEDNVQGALLAAEHINRGAINIGVEDRLFPEDALELIWNYIGWRPDEVVYLENKNTGPVNRIADAGRLMKLGWIPKWSFEQGLKQTIDWYYSTHKEEDVRKDFERKLTEI